MFSFAITGKGEGVLQKSSIPFSHTKEKAGRMEKRMRTKWRLRLGETAYLEHTGWIKESDCRSCDGQPFGWNR
mgnify:CR=1 FL=1